MPLPPLSEFWQSWGIAPRKIILTFRDVSEIFSTQTQNKSMPEKIVINQTNKGCLSGCGTLLAIAILGPIIWAILVPNVSKNTAPSDTNQERAKVSSTPPPATSTPQQKISPEPAPSSTPQPVLTNTPPTNQTEIAQPQASGTASPVPSPTPTPAGPKTKKVKLLVEKLIYTSSGSKKKIPATTEASIVGHSGDTLTLKAEGEIFNVKSTEVELEP